MKYLISLFIILGSYASALASSAHTVVTTVPFDFVIGNQTLPAGTYCIREVADGTNILLVRRKDGTGTGIMVPAGVDFVSDHGNGKLVFQHIGGTYVLTAIVSDDRNYILSSQDHSARVPDPSSTLVTSGP
ncbi:MAG TPA: hypothetical protein VN176_08040 [Verrucomicrobiae bacterium]|jgi:hypothetical protein|nr:hypothetical protein [Verrucomicrobiae bacterium]